MGFVLLYASAGFWSACLICSLVEYIVHRLMHARILLGKKHAEHHRDGDGQGVLGEVWNYLFGGIPVIASGFIVCAFVLNSFPAGYGFLAGCLVYASLAGYAHQLQHERPELVFWLVRPVHHLHHAHHLWRHNFGILIDVWDRVFGTYKAVDWKPERRARDFPIRSFFEIKWF